MRRAALLLYAMAPADRDWMLGQLPASGRDQLRSLLRELADLGIPHDRALLKQVVAEARPAQAGTASALAAPAVDEGVAALVAAITAAGAARVAGVMHEEPVALIATFLRVHDWTWRDAFLRALGPVRARPVKDALAAAGPGVPQAAAREKERLLLGAVLRRVKALPQGDPLEPAIAGSAPIKDRAHPRRHWLKRLPGPSVHGVAR